MNRSNTIQFLFRWFISILAFGYFIGSVWAADSTQQKQSILEDKKQTETKKDSIGVKDGTYVGISEGWTGMKAEVKIQKGRISGIKILEINGTPEFYEKVVDLLPDRILSKNSLEVDGISGATLSSNSMKEAIGHALDQAKEKK
jgi:uncharacterized protein with FMN-binding domain